MDRRLNPYQCAHSEGIFDAASLDNVAKRAAATLLADDALGKHFVSWARDLEIVKRENDWNTLAPKRAEYGRRQVMVNIMGVRDVGPERTNYGAHATGGVNRVNDSCGNDKLIDKGLRRFELDGISEILSPRGRFVFGEVHRKWSNRPPGVLQ